MRESSRSFSEHLFIKLIFHFAATLFFFFVFFLTSLHFLPELMRTWTTDGTRCSFSELKARGQRDTRDQSCNPPASRAGSSNPPPLWSLAFVTPLHIKRLHESQGGWDWCSPSTWTWNITTYFQRGGGGGCCVIRAKCNDGNGLTRKRPLWGSVINPEPGGSQLGD